MKWLLGGAAIIAVLAWLRWLLRRAFSTATVSPPATSPAQLRIVKENEAKKQAIDSAAEAEKQKVDNASSEDIDAGFVDHMLRPPPKD